MSAINLTIAGIIPSRYASQRLPGKPLVTIHGKTMVQRVYEQACKAETLARVIVATDDQRVYDHVLSFGGDALLTSSQHENGTERCGEVQALHGKDWDAVINIQGDEPFINPRQIDLVGRSFQDGFQGIVTLAKKISDNEELANPGIVKVVVNKYQEALYFSRSMIPYCRESKEQDWHHNHTYYKHIGIYGYHFSVLQSVIHLPPTPLEKTESLEQLRWLEHGYRIRVEETDLESRSVDTPEDVKRLQQELK